MRAPGSRPWRFLAPAATLLLALTACTTPPPARGPGPALPGGAAGPAGEDGPTGSPYWVDPDGPAARQVLAWEAQGRHADAQVLRRIAEEPVALWAPAGDPAPAVRRAVRSAGPAQRVVVLTVHQLPYRDCGRTAVAGGPLPRPGAGDAGAYRRWVEAFAGAVGGARAVVVLEPGAVGQVLDGDGCLTGARREERLRLLGEAVERLKRNPATKVYLDAGEADPERDPEQLAAVLGRAGLARADGFALNVSGFRPDAEVRAFGARLSKATGGKHFVVDTGRNGAGAPPGGPARPGRPACNPPGRALGTPPTDRTGDPLVDAYLWIRPPGDSDGPCRGGPPAGTWWPEHALGLARRAVR
ncbi:glycoside hydrolase family 6 protein [Streptomyces antimicrobicus]|uniref:Glucanase n=1 Tax=Streptomyces antimicrobicus TaxID=2883108 RepID=A0ABS8AZS8_9ACTN|nr:glycoside hydrolase family 6 protein [Streptomyces antimicrobicus]MCB5177861.1 glycoside hydrolase family 6 protein [Streptomyces antimicrobicus]